MKGLTPFVESNALLAVVRDDFDEARDLLRGLSAIELDQLGQHAHDLAHLCWDLGAERSHEHPAARPPDSPYTKGSL